MCAIFGVVGKYETQTAQKAFQTLKHRGVDESHIACDTSHFFGVHRLAINAINASYTQPLRHNTITFVMNGEVYNYRELAKELNITTQSDTEVAFVAYQKWGDLFVNKLRGMFAIAILDGETLKLFRDPLGKKPLFYRISQDAIAFSSELKALYALQPMKLNTMQLPVYLSYQSTIAPHTIDASCKQVEAGSYMIFKSDQSTQTHHYFDPLNTPISIHSETQAISQIKQTLIHSVQLRIPSEVSCGALLSGGLDSSLIAAIASKETPLRTFSIGYDGYEQYDERPFATQVAKHIGSQHNTYNFTKEDFLETIEEVINVLDEPLGDPATIPLCFLLKQIQNEGIKVVLTGDGSDELFLGYKPYKEFLDLEQLATLKHKQWMRHFLRSNYSMNKEWEWHKRIFEETTLFRSSAELFSDLQQNRLLRMNVRDDNSLRAIEPLLGRFQKSKRTAPADWYTFIDLHIQLSEVFLRKLDRTSMAHSIEARTPFLDKTLIETVFATDPSLRTAQMPKNWIKEIAKTYLPHSIIQRKKKGFNYPYLVWLQESGEIHTITKVQERFGFFHKEHLFWLLSEAQKGKFQHQIFAIYMWCKWVEKKQ